MKTKTKYISVRMPQDEWSELIALLSKQTGYQAAKFSDNQIVQYAIHYAAVSLKHDQIKEAK